MAEEVAHRRQEQGAPAVERARLDDPVGSAAFDELLVDHQVGRRRLRRPAQPVRVPPRQAEPERIDEAVLELVGDRPRRIGYTVPSARLRGLHERLAGHAPGAGLHRPREHRPHVVQLLARTVKRSSVQLLEVLGELGDRHPAIVRVGDVRRRPPVELVE